MLLQGSALAMIHRVNETMCINIQYSTGPCRDLQIYQYQPTYTCLSAALTILRKKQRNMPPSFILVKALYTAVSRRSASLYTYFTHRQVGKLTCSALDGLQCIKQWFTRTYCVLVYGSARWNCCPAVPFNDLWQPVPCLYHNLDKLGIGSDTELFMLLYIPRCNIVIFNWGPLYCYVYVYTAWIRRILGKCKIVKLKKKNVMFYKKKIQFSQPTFHSSVVEKDNIRIFPWPSEERETIGVENCCPADLQGCREKSRSTWKTYVTPPLLPTLPIFEASVSLSNRYEDWQCIILYPILHRSPSWLRSREWGGGGWTPLYLAHNALTIH